jgi:putative SOS response-associated peptidase YedK
MCGRYVLYSAEEILRQIFEFSNRHPVSPRFNIAPSQTVMAVRLGPDGRREAVGLRWGLLPAWAKPGDRRPAPINARAETAGGRLMFRDALRRRRCLVPADGWYEWKRSGRSRQPHFIRRRDRAPMALAGIWERWEQPGLQAVESVALLTTAPDASLSSIHNRMPLVLQPADYAPWLDPSYDIAGALVRLMDAGTKGPWEFHPVGPGVNRAGSDGPGLTEPVAAPLAPQGELFT